MDAATNQQKPFEASGINSISYTVPNTFFPIHDAPDAKSWTPCLAARRNTTQLRAWSRVPLPTQSSRTFSGTVMKRVGLMKPRVAQNTLAKATEAINNTSATTGICPDGMPPRRIARRLDSYSPSPADHESAGDPPSKLDVASLNMQAKADVAFAVKEYPTSRTRDEIRQCRAGHYVKTIPAKRRFNDMFSAGNRLRTYLDVLDMPLNTGFHPNTTRPLAPIDSQPLHSPIKSTQSPFKSPVNIRSPLSQDPVTPAAVINPPETLTSSHSKSPTKRSSRHKSPPIKTDAASISPTVKLLPVESPTVQPSPTKSASPPPATPLNAPAASIKVFETPSTFPKASQPGLALAGMQRYSAIKETTSPLQLPPPTSLALASPCPANSATESPHIQSPSKPYSPVAPTPTRHVCADPATPQVSTPGSTAADDNASPIRFLSKLFAQSPAPAPALSFTPKLPTPQAVPDFDFGTTSPSFNSVTWMNSVENPGQQRIRGSKGSSRRQSEPLMRNCLKTQARRQTMSPRKLVFKSELTFQDQEAPSLSPSKPDLESGNGTQTDTSASPEPSAKPTSLDAPVLATPKLDVPDKHVSEESPESSQTKKSGSGEVLNIDMRQNPDIFGTRASSLGPSPVLSSGPLPSIVEDGTESEASALHTDDGRLEVQFKMAPKFASVVPDSQGSPAQHHEPPTPEAGGSTSPSKSPTVQTSPERKPAGINGLGIFDEILGSDSPESSTEASPAATSPAAKREDTEQASDDEVVSETPEKNSELSPAIRAQSPSPPLNLSFTAVNAPQSKPESNTPPVAIFKTRSPEKTLALEPETREDDYDSPGRDYMREFIRRSKPKRPSTTEAGSPVAPSAKRQPLGPKSPNTESPLKAKRKLENEKDPQESPLKRASTKPEAKKMRRYGMGLKKRNIVRDKKEEDSDRIDVESPADVLAAVDELDDVTEGNSAASRRSSRIKKQAVTAPLSKSAIPTPIKIGRSTGTTLNSAVRSEQQDLTYQTRMNTRKNKGNAEYPAQWLARQSEEAQSDSETEMVNPEQAASDDARKCVAWKSPLAAYQEEEDEKLKKKGSKTAKTVRTSGIAKPATRAKTTAEKERTARLAEHFGMVSNGTPAKPQRVTRSRMRS